MSRIVFSKSSFIAGVTISLVLISLPIFLLRFTDLAMFPWIPGTALVGWLGGRGLHDSEGFAFLLLGILVDFILYLIIFTVLVSVFRRNEISK